MADGGFVDWTATLLANRKERLLISGYGVDRLAGLSELDVAASGSRIAIRCALITAILARYDQDGR